LGERNAARRLPRRSVNRCQRFRVTSAKALIEALLERWRSAENTGDFAAY
jgi:hypothetical protein